MKFIKDLLNAVAPKENRLLAAVAFIRTFGQGIRGSAVVAVLIGTGVTVADLTSIDWVLVGYTAAAIVATALIAGLDAYFSVLSHGLNAKYTEAVITSLPKQMEANEKVAQAVDDAAKHRAA